MNEKTKNEALTILQSIGLLVDSHLRETDAVQSNQELLEEVEELGLHVGRVFDKLFLTM